MPNTIAQNLTRLANAKEAIAEAIEEKGVMLEEGDGFEDFADAISSIAANLTTKTITENGTYNASSDNTDGYSTVTVNVEGNKFIVGQAQGITTAYIGIHGNAKREDV